MSVDPHFMDDLGHFLLIAACGIALFAGLIGFGLGVIFQ